MENQISKKIKEARLRKNLSIDAVATALELSANAYRKIEMNYTKLSVKRLYDIAEIFELDVIDFLESKNKNSDKELYKKKLHAMENSYKVNKDLYEKQIETLKEEIYFLREKVLKNSSLALNISGN